MNETEIITLVTSYINQAIGGLDKENPKFDFKRSWYDLTNPKGINELLKDASSIANTVGPDGYIVIGFDDKTGQFYHSNFRQSGLRDSSDLINLINSKVDRLFTVNTLDVVIDGNSLSIIHIPPSLDKPHVIRQYLKFASNGDLKQQEDNKIFVRKNSTSVSASKYDLELMYYDRKNIIPDYLIHANFHLEKCNIDINYVHHISFTFYLTLENSGRRAVAINHLKLKLYLYDDPSEHEIINLVSGDDYFAINILINSGQIWNERVELLDDNPRFIQHEDHLEDNPRFIENKKSIAADFQRNKKRLKTSLLEIHLSNGEILFADLKKIL